jgi:hypothetical protein
VLKNTIELAVGIQLAKKKLRASEASPLICMGVGLTEQKTSNIEVKYLFILRY